MRRLSRFAFDVLRNTRHAICVTHYVLRTAYCVFILLLLAYPSPLQSAINNQQSPISNLQSPISIDSTAVVHTFGGQMVFTLAARSPNEITAATLLLRAGADARTEVLAAEFVPGAQIEARATRNLQAQPLQPFAVVSYAWRLADSAGNSLTTPEQTYAYLDNRFQWETVARGPIHAHWHSGDFAFGQAVADLGYEALNRARRLTNAPPPEKLDIYVYEKLADLQAGQRLGGRAWVGGHADPALGVVLVYAAPEPIELLRLENDLAHELMHVMIYPLVVPNYDRLPAWLDEGLAVNAELQPNPNYAAALETAVKTETLLPLESLCAAFGLDASQATLSYAESASVVRYLQDRWGPAAIRQLLNAYREGASCQGGAQRTLNLSLAELQADWEQEVLRASPLNHFLRQMFPYVLVFGPIALILAALLIAPKRKT